MHGHDHLHATHGFSASRHQCARSACWDSRSRGALQECGTASAESARVGAFRRHAGLQEQRTGCTVTCSTTREAVELHSGCRLPTAHCVASTASCHTPRASKATGRSPGTGSSPRGAFPACFVMTGSGRALWMPARVATFGRVHSSEAEYKTAAFTAPVK